MERWSGKRSRAALMALGAAGIVALLVALWPVLTVLGTMLALALVMMAAALPICRVLERRFSPSLSAAASFLVLSLLLLCALGLLIPALLRQLQQLAAAVPPLMETGREWLSGVERALAEKGVGFSLSQSGLLESLGKQAAEALPRVLTAVQGAATGVSQLMLAPLVAFYLLRDRRRIAGYLTMLVPLRHRRAVVRACREMRRETAGFLRGQLLICSCVGVLTALGLMLVGTPGWLLLGLLMGVMELIPYVGPLVAGIPAVLLALGGGLPRALWTLGVLVAVQQAEGSFLSPNLLSGATKLSPLAVLLAISAGGLIGGTVGMLAALPVVVSVRGAVRVLRAPSQSPDL